MSDAIRMKLKPISAVLFFPSALLLLGGGRGVCHGLSLSMSTTPIVESESAKLSRSRLYESLRSPAGKLTLSPEIVIPEPADPTALLLQSSEVTRLSERIRTAAKANTAWIGGSIGSLRTFAAEQESARGNFPGPVPVVYCNAKVRSDLRFDSECLADLADAGVEGVLVPFLDEKAVATAEEFSKEAELWAVGRARCNAAWEAGVQPIPEVVLSHGSTWGEEEVEKLVDEVAKACGGVEPVSIVLSVPLPEEEDGEANSEAPELPKMSKALGKRIPILGSVRTTAGAGRMGSYVALLKENGYTGAFLRSDCVPGFRMNPDLEVVGGFWSAAIGDLKSTKSKSFNFRSKVKLESDVPMAWYNYQKDVMESGALGDAPQSSDLDTSSGDFMGF